MKTFCIYHKVDLDGMCAAAVVLRAIPDAILYPYQYGDPIDLEGFRGARVVMVDVSLQPYERMLELGEVCTLTWIDHHATAIEEHGRQGQAILTTSVLEVGKAGCELTWEHFFPNEPVPRAVKLLGRYDVWDHGADHLVMPFQMGMRQFDADPSWPSWGTLMNTDFAATALTDRIASEGEVILKYQKEQWANACRSSFEADFEGLRCVCLNMPRANSNVFESVWDPKRHDAMLSFHNSGGRHWSVSLYTAKEGVDVGAVAKAWGGGGHQQAAGFQVKALPPQLQPQIGGE